MLAKSVSFKVVLAGSHQSGKTLFMMRWYDPECQVSTQPTIGADFRCKDVTVNGQSFKVQLWDTAGQEAYHSITAPYFRSCKGVFLLFDITDQSSFESLGYWMDMIRNNCYDMPYVIIVANKCDLPHTEATRFKVTEYCKGKNLPLFFTSALTGENVENAANCMVLRLAQSMVMKPVISEHINLAAPREETKSCC